MLKLATSSTLQTISSTHQNKWKKKWENQSSHSQDTKEILIRKKIILGEQGLYDKHPPLK